MALVGFDTSMAATSACLVRDDGRAFCTGLPDPDRLLGPANHSAELLPELERLLADSSTEWTGIEAIAVGVGPGTFTGLRIGVSTARALGQALGVPVKPVSSLRALALGLAAGVGAPPARPLLALIDAKRRQVFAALYRLAEGRFPAEAGAEPTRPDPAPLLEQLWEPFVSASEPLLECIGELDQEPLAAGDWAIESREALELAGVEVPDAGSGVHAVNALYICRLAMTVEPAAPQDVYPVYLRLPDAEINRQLADKQGK